MYLILPHDLMVLGGHNIMLNFGLYDVGSISSLIGPLWVSSRQSPIGLNMTFSYRPVNLVYWLSVWHLEKLSCVWVYGSLLCCLFMFGVQRTSCGSGGPSRSSGPPGGPPDPSGSSHVWCWLLLMMPVGMTMGGHWNVSMVTLRWGDIMVGLILWYMCVGL